MLVPASLYKEEILREFKKRYYTEDLFYEVGGLHNYCPQIADEPSEQTYQFAILDQDKLVGYFGYQVNLYTSNAYNFGLISFDKGNATVTKDVYFKLNGLVNKLNRVEYRVVEGNPVQEIYDRFCDKCDGRKLVLRDVFRDRDGNYRNEIIYEVVKDRR